MNKETISFAITNEQVAEIIAFYDRYQRINNGEYIVFQADYNQILITIYKNNKGKHKITFVGIDALLEAKKWNNDIQINKVKNMYFILYVSFVKTKSDCCDT